MGQLFPLLLNQFVIAQWLAAASCSLNAPRFGGVKIGLGLTGKLGRAAVHGSVHGMVHGLVHGMVHGCLG